MICRSNPTANHSSYHSRGRILANQLPRIPLPPTGSHCSTSIHTLIQQVRVHTDRNLRPAVRDLGDHKVSGNATVGIEMIIERASGSPVPFTRGLTPEVLYDSPTVSMHSGHDVALSRTSSIEELPEDEDGSSHLHPANVAYYGLSRVATGSSGRSPESEYRGRSRSRFSFRKVAHVFDAMRERVRSQSPRAGSEERGRTLIKGKDNARVGAHGVWDTLPHVGVTEVSEDDGVNDQRGDGWIVFPKGTWMAYLLMCSELIGGAGTYTYPIFFTIPNNSSPSMKADHGSMMWKVKAEVKRPSALKLKMTAQREVIVVCAPADNDSDEAEGIDVERQWDSQFQYRIQISKRSFPVGGKIPIQLSITPLAKIKVHRILVHLDGEYSRCLTRDSYLLTLHKSALSTTRKPRLTPCLILYDERRC
jgi:hypothetical protein